MSTISIDEINQKAKADICGFVEECEDAYTNRIKATAEKLSDYILERPVVLISGPSGAGKTTSALRLEEQLLKLGINSYTISMDDYFHTRSETPPPLDENGKEDLESPLCVDVQLFTKHLTTLALGGEIQIPKFNFNTQSRENITTPFKLEKDEVVVIEGIHALNPAVVGEAMKYAIGIYINLQTEVALPDGATVKESNIRILRRIIRDNTFRARSPVETVEAWRSVARGEKLYISPHKNNASFLIDTFIPYEACVTAPIVAKLMENSISDTTNEYIREISKTVPLFAEAPQNVIPSHSVLREFVAE